MAVVIRKTHPYSAIFWAVLLGTGFAYEMYTLKRDDDEHEPLTHHTRKILNLNNRKGPMYWLLLGFWLWLGRHFFWDTENY